jgi:hypothetical protein
MPQQQIVLCLGGMITYYLMFIAFVLLRTKPQFRSLKPQWRAIIGIPGAIIGYAFPCFPRGCPIFNLPTAICVFLSVV